MKRLLRGVQRFQREVFAPRRSFFEELARAQFPEVLFITCSDSRVVPNEFTQTDAGILFTLRNAGNLVPPHGEQGSEAGTIEYAVRALRVRDVIVCGHSRCGAMEALLEPERVNGLPEISRWLVHAEATRAAVESKYSGLTREERLDATVRENVLVQLEHLRTHPTVAHALADGTVTLHGWVYELESGEVLNYEFDEKRWVPLRDTRASLTPRTPLAPVGASCCEPTDKAS